MKPIFFLISIFFIANGLALANVLPPPPPDSKGVELTQDYPDYIFYFGKYYVFDENGKSISKIDLEKIELTTLKPFVIKQPKRLIYRILKKNISTPSKLS